MGGPGQQSLDLGGRSPSLEWASAFFGLRVERGLATGHPDWPSACRPLNSVPMAHSPHGFPLPRSPLPSLGPLSQALSPIEHTAYMNRTYPGPGAGGWADSVPSPEPFARTLPPLADTQAAAPSAADGQEPLFQRAPPKGFRPNPLFQADGPQSVGGWLQASPATAVPADLQHRPPPPLPQRLYSTLEGLPPPGVPLRTRIPAFQPGGRQEKR